jgi:hypothetical protein
MRAHHSWIKIVSWVTLLILANVTKVIAAPPEIEWTASYNGPASYWESIRDAAVHEGSLHVVGFATFEFLKRGYVTVKYAPDGSEAWYRIYEGIDGPNQSSEASSIAVDDAGNVYVTGYSMTGNDPIFADLATLKYSPEGELLWEHRYRGSGGNAQPLAIALDGSSLYVAGATWINDGFDVLLLKYDLDGNLLWSRTPGRPGVAMDAAYCMALDENGNIVLGGYTTPPMSDVDVYVLKYSPEGSLRWEWTLPGYANVEEVWDLTVDGDGNTYALAQYAPPGSHTSLLTVKLSESGSLLWYSIFSGESTGDYAAGIELAPNGNVFVAGAAWENGSQNAMTLLKYTPSGQLLWSRRERAGYFSAECNDLVVDAAGAAYMTGVAFNENGREDYLTAKYNGSGNPVWTAAWDAPEGRSDFGYLVRVGADQRVYVAGDAWRDFDNYYDITSVVYRQSDPAAIPGTTPELASEMTLEPNPVRAGKFVTFRSNETGPVELFGMDGRRILTLDEVGVPGSGGALHFRAPTAGVYMLRAGDRTRKLVVIAN